VAALLEVLLPTRIRRPTGRAVLFSLGFALGCAQAASSPDRHVPEDKPYPGTINLAVDLSDVRHRVFRVHESLPAKPGPLVLLYPQWIPGEHRPSGPLVGIAGLKITAGGQPIAWRRDPEDPFALNVQVPPGVDRVDVQFQYLSPTAATQDGPRACVTNNLLQLEWNQVVLYPAGFYARQITVQPTVTLPDAWSFASALESTGAAGSSARFKPVDLETLVDSPLMAGRYFKRIEIGPDAPPVYLDLVADRAGNLAASADQLKQQQALVREAYALF
jgi:predicted metalloprotease with PDZ domain